jgi:hypothetical protein
LAAASAAGLAAGVASGLVAAGAAGLAAGAAGGLAAAGAAGLAAGAAGGLAAAGAAGLAAGAAVLGSLVHWRIPGPGGSFMLFNPCCNAASDTGVLTVIERWPLALGPPTSEPSARKPKPAAVMASESML